MVNHKTYEMFLKPSTSIVSQDRPYKDKLAALKAHMVDKDEANIEELTAWFASEG